jgi:hypothetical protein
MAINTTITDEEARTYKSCLSGIILRIYRVESLCGVMRRANEDNEDDKESILCDMRFTAELAADTLRELARELDELKEDIFSRASC